MGARGGGGGGERVGCRPLENHFKKFRYMRGLFATFSLCGGLFCYVFSLWGCFFTIWGPFSPCRGLFLSLGGFGACPPLRKFLQALMPHMVKKDPTRRKKCSKEANKPPPIENPPPPHGERLLVRRKKVTPPMIISAAAHAPELKLFLSLKYYFLPIYDVKFYWLP